MTLIDISTFVPALGDPFQSGINRGVAKCTPWAGDCAAAELDGATFVIPDTLRVPIVNSVPQVPFDLEPTTDGDYCWRIIMEFHQPRFRQVRFVAVPDLGPVPYEDLVDVDPFTYVPTANHSAAWQAELAKRPTTDGSILSIMSMTQTEFEAITPPDTQLTFIIP